MEDDMAGGGHPNPPAAQPELAGPVESMSDAGAPEPLLTVLRYMVGGGEVTRKDARQAYSACTRLTAQAWGDTADRLRQAKETVANAHAVDWLLAELATLPAAIRATRGKSLEGLDPGNPVLAAALAVAGSPRLSVPDWGTQFSKAAGAYRAKVPRVAPACPVSLATVARYDGDGLWPTEVELPPELGDETDQELWAVLSRAAECGAMLARELVARRDSLAMITSAKSGRHIRSGHPGLAIAKHALNLGLRKGTKGKGPIGPLEGSLRVRVAIRASRYLEARLALEKVMAPLRRSPDLVGLDASRADLWARLSVLFWNPSLEGREWAAGLPKEAVVLLDSMAIALGREQVRTQLAEELASRAAGQGPASFPECFEQLQANEDQGQDVLQRWFADLNWAATESLGQDLLGRAISDRQRLWVLRGMCRTAPEHDLHPSFLGWAGKVVPSALVLTVEGLAIHRLEAAAWHACTETLKQGAARRRALAKGIADQAVDLRLTAPWLPETILDAARDLSRALEASAHTLERELDHLVPREVSDPPAPGPVGADRVTTWRSMTFDPGRSEAASAKLRRKVLADLLYGLDRERAALATTIRGAGNLPPQFWSAFWEAVVVSGADVDLSHAWSEASQDARIVEAIAEAVITHSTGATQPMVVPPEAAEAILEILRSRIEAVRRRLEDARRPRPLERAARAAHNQLVAAIDATAKPLIEWRTQLETELSDGA